MKQVQFMVEVVATEGQPTIIIRDPRGIIVKLTTQTKDVDSFLHEVVTNLYKSSNTENSHE